MAEDTQPRIQINDLNKFIMFAETPGVQGKRAKLTWSERDGNPRITVFTNDPKDTIGRGILNAPLNPETFFAFLDRFEDIALGENDKKGKIDCYTSVRDQEGKTVGTEKKLVSELVYGKDANGIIWFGVSAPNRPKIKFVFKISEFHKIYNSDGSVFTEAQASQAQAVSVIRAIRHIFYTITGGFRKPISGNGGQNSGSNDFSYKPSEKITPAEDFQDLTF